MRNALSKKIVDIEPSGIRKFFDVVSEIPDAISLGVGEPDFDTPWNVREEGIYGLILIFLKPASAALIPARYL